MSKRMIPDHILQAAWKIDDATNYLYNTLTGKWNLDESVLDAIEILRKAEASIIGVQIPPYHASFKL